MKLSQLSEPTQRMWAWESWLFPSSALSWCGWGRDAPLTASRWWERWSCGHMSWRAIPGPHQLAAAFGGVAPAPRLGITVELAMMVQGWESWHWDHESRKIDPSTARWCEGVKAMLESSWWQGRAGALTNPAMIQAQKQGYGLTHLNMYSICDLWEHMQGLIMQTQNYRLSRTHGNRISMKTPSEEQALIV